MLLRLARICLMRWSSVTYPSWFLIHSLWIILTYATPMKLKGITYCTKIVMMVRYCSHSILGSGNADRHLLTFTTKISISLTELKKPYGRANANARIQMTKMISAPLCLVILGFSGCSKTLCLSNAMAVRVKVDTYEETMME